LPWPAEGKIEKTLQGHSDVVNFVAFNPVRANCTLASCSADSSIKLWDIKSYSCLKTFNGHDHYVSGLAFLPSGDAFVSCSRDKTLKLWEGKVLRPARGSAVIPARHRAYALL
jgi:WD40 repeat protein